MMSDKFVRNTRKTKALHEMGRKKFKISYWRLSQVPYYPFLLVKN